MLILVQALLQLSYVLMYVIHYIYTGMYINSCIVLLTVCIALCCTIGGAGRDGEGIPHRIWIYVRYRQGNRIVMSMYCICVCTV